jgi:hypothetical protein
LFIAVVVESWMVMPLPAHVADAMHAKCEYLDRSSPLELSRASVSSPLRWRRSLSRGSKPRSTPHQ